jgi:hypothetical protein
MKIYTGIGSRATPKPILEIMTGYAVYLANQGYTLRSGRAPGADQAFEKGTGWPLIEIYIPWNGFEGAFDSWDGYLIPFYTDETMAIAAQYHPNWAACSDGARKLHARNVLQILGCDLKTPTEFVCCWTPNGAGGGGTGQAIRIAQAHDIPVFDLGAAGGESALIDYINGKT